MGRGRGLRVVDTERKVFEWERNIVRVEREIAVDGEVAVNSEEPSIDQVVSSEFHLVDVVTELVAEDLLITGKLLPSFVYQSTIGSGEEVSGVITYYSLQGEPVPFRHTMELPVIPAGGDVKTDCRILHASAERRDHHGIRVEGQILVDSTIVAPQRKELVINAQVTPPAGLNVAKDVFRVAQTLGTYNSRAHVQTVLDLPYLRPQVSRVLLVHANPTNLHWENVKGKIKIEGDLTATMMYLSRDEEGREGIEKAEWGRESGSALHWHMEIEGKNIGEDTRFLPSVTVASCNVESYGKENIRFEAVIAAEVSPYRLAEGEVVVDLASPELILDLNRRNVEIEDILSDQSSILTVERTIELPSGRPGIGRILDYQILPQKMSGECETGKILLDGSADLNLVYTAGDEERFPGVYTADWERSSALVWAESLEVPVAEEGFRAEVEGKVLGVSLEVVDGRRIRLTMEVILRTRVLEQKSLSVIDDWAVVPKVAPGSRPTMIFYLTQPGDTWWKVARKYQITMAALSGENHLSLSDPLPVGKRLIIPTGPMAKITTLK